MIEIKFISFQEAKELAAQKRNCASWEQLVRITTPHIVSTAEQEAADLYCEIKVKNLAQPDVSGQLPPMFIRWCISKNIEVYSGDAIGITSMDEGGMFPVVSAEILFEIFMEETGGNFR